MTLRVRYPLPW